MWTYCTERNRSPRVRRAFTACFAAVVLSAVPRGWAQSYAIPWSTLDSCGVLWSAGGDFKLGATIAQPDAGSFTVPMSGGEFKLVGGFWPVASISAPCNGFAACDTDCNGTVNPFDIQPFIELLGPGPTPCSTCAGDANGDGTVNPFDINAFVACVSG